MNFVNSSVQTKAPHSMYLGILAINISNKSNVIGTPDTRVQRPTDRYHWTALDNIFVKPAAFGMSAANSDYDYSQETDF